MKTKPTISVKVYLTPTHLDEMQLKDKNIVVIDVLRASTTIATALGNGAKEIIPVQNVESVVKISGNLSGGMTLRAGERNGKTIEGFNLGNSPAEFTKEAVEGKSIIFLTTNGSAAMVKGRHAKNLIIASFVNLSSVIAFLKELREDFIIMCAGQDNDFSLEDAVCAGKIINALDDVTETIIIPDDAAAAAMALDKSFGKNVLKMLKSSDHGKYLTDIGFADDLKLCAGTDSIPLLPVLSGNVIRVHKDTPKAS